MRHTVLTAEVSDANRDGKGRFTKGNSGGPGRPKRTKEEKYLTSMVRCVKLKDWRDIVERAVADAKDGDAKAREWLSNYLLGKPSQELKVKGETDLRILLEWDDAESYNQAAEAP